MQNNFDKYIQEKNPEKLMINLGCGQNYHTDWINIDFLSDNKNVIAYDLTEGIPFSSCSFDVAYHSHVLEHFSLNEGDLFIKECYRVLKPGGILRIAVPNLEVIARNYLRFLEQALSHEKDADRKYEWTKLELFDQMTRNKTGGLYQKFLLHSDEETRKFAHSRLGNEINAIAFGGNSTFFQRLKNKSFLGLLTALRINFAKGLLILLGGKRFVAAFETGLFRLSGETHQYMYDRYSLTRLLKKNHFEQIKELTAFESGIQNFQHYNLDVVDGVIRKPDSIFIEACKV